MESYSYSGNSGFFDDLDIEGRNFVIDEWHAEEPFAKTNPENPGPIESPPAVSKDPKSENDEKKWLLTVVKLDDGTMGFAHTVDSIGVMWRCHPCNMVFEGKDMFQEHINTEKHKTVMARPHHKKVFFTKLVVEAPHIEPGEPVPPGFEDIIQDVCQLQSALDEFNEAPIIGLEFLVELTNPDPANEPRYICLLCDKRGDPRSILKHMTSQSHYQKYLGRYFRLVYVALNNIPKQPSYKNGLCLLTQYIVGKIEERFGRLRPKVMEEIKFNQPGERAELTAKIDGERHFRETDEDNFAELVDVKYVKDPRLLRPVSQWPPHLHPSYSLSTVEPPPPSQDPGEENSKSSTSSDKGRVPFKSKPVTGNIRKRQESPEVVTLGENSPDSKSESKKSRKSLSPLSPDDSPQDSRRSRDRQRSRSRRRSRSRSLSRGRYGGGGGRRLPYRRSRSPSYPRNLSRRSRSPRRMRYSPGPRHRRDGRRYSRSRSKSRSRHRSPPSFRQRRSRSRSPYRPRYRQRSPVYRDSRPRYPDERHVYRRESISRREKLSEELKGLESKLLSKLKYYEKNPEKHPMYPEEWKLFWNRRFKELQASGVDPLQHDFKPEWIEFWTKKMVELHEEDLKKQTAELKKKIEAEIELDKERTTERSRNSRSQERTRNTSRDRSRESSRPRQPDVSVNDMKNLWKAYTGTEIKVDSNSKRSPSPWEDPNSKEKKTKKELALEPLGSPISDDEVDLGDDLDNISEKSIPEVTYAPPRHYYHQMYDERGMPVSSMYAQTMARFPRKAMPFAKEPLNVITVIRSISVLEDQLGPSLGPKIVDLLSCALALEKEKPKSSATLLTNANMVLLETVKEKLKGQFLARVIPGNLVGAAKHAIANIDELVRLAPRAPSPPKFTPTPVFDKPTDPIPVPGVGTVDKVAIANQIAATLTAQGRTDVSQEELEMLINAVVGMREAEAQGGSANVNVEQVI
nr:PREDICTED: uncharacterized protein CG7065-like isoform X2 [Bemisia tabaci]